MGGPWKLPLPLGWATGAGGVRHHVGPQRGKCSWAAGRTQDQLGGGGSPGIGCLLSYLHPGSASTWMTAMSLQTRRPAQAISTWPSQSPPCLSLVFWFRASTFYFRWGGSPGLGLHQGEQQRLEIRPHLQPGVNYLPASLCLRGTCEAR